jgi:hypothetical protein
MTIQSKKIISFFPLVNIIVIILWIRFYSRNGLSHVHFFKNLIKIFLVLVLLHIPRIILRFVGVSDTIQQILAFASFYLTFVTWAFLAIRDEKKYLYENTNHN